jgi:hypothetical protein
MMFNLVNHVKINNLKLVISMNNIMSQTNLEQAIIDAFEAMGEQKQATQAYFSFLKSQIHLPVEKGSLETDPMVLFLEHGEHVFLPIFSHIQYLQTWAAEQIDQIDIYTITGVELIKGLGEHVIVALNPGTKTYKEFNPDEIDKLRTMVLKIQSLANHS